MGNTSCSPGIGPASVTASNDLYAYECVAIQWHRRRKGITAPMLSVAARSVGWGSVFVGDCAHIRRCCNEMCRLWRLIVNAIKVDNLGRAPKRCTVGTNDRVQLFASFCFPLGRQCKHTTFRHLVPLQTSTKDQSYKNFFSYRPKSNIFKIYSGENFCIPKIYITYFVK